MPSGCSTTAWLQSMAQLRHDPVGGIIPRNRGKFPWGLVPTGSGPQSIAFSCLKNQWLYGRYNELVNRAYFMVYKPTFTSLGGPILYRKYTDWWLEHDFLPWLLINHKKNGFSGTIWLGFDETINRNLHLIGGDWNMNGLWLSIQEWMSSSQLTNSLTHSIIFQSR